MKYLNEKQDDFNSDIRETLTNMIKIFAEGPSTEDYTQCNHSELAEKTLSWRHGTFAVLTAKTKKELDEISTHLLYLADEPKSDLTHVQDFDRLKEIILEQKDEKKLFFVGDLSRFGTKDKEKGYLGLQFHSLSKDNNICIVCDSLTIRGFEIGILNLSCERIEDLASVIIGHKDSDLHVIKNRFGPTD